MEHSSLQETILEQFKEDPEIIGNYKRFERIQKEQGFAHDETISAAIQLGQLLLLRGVYLESLGLLNQARGALQDRRDALHPLMAEVLASLGDLYLAQGMHQESLPYFEKALAVREALCISDNEETARLFMKTGEIFATNGDLIGAEDFFNRAYQVARDVCPESDAIRGDIANNLGVILTSKKEFDRAAEFFREAAQHRVAEYGHIREESAMAYLTLAKAYELNNEPKHQAKSLYHAIEIREELYGREDPTVGTLKDQYQRIIESLNLDTKKEEPQPTKVQPKAENKNPPASTKLAQTLIEAALIALEDKNLEVAKIVLKLVNPNSVDGDPDSTHEIAKKIYLFSKEIINK